MKDEILISSKTIIKVILLPLLVALTIISHYKCGVYFCDFEHTDVNPIFHLTQTILILPCIIIVGYYIIQYIHNFYINNRVYKIKNPLVKQSKNFDYTKTSKLINQLDNTTNLEEQDMILEELKKINNH